MVKACLSVIRAVNFVERTDQMSGKSLIILLIYQHLFPSLHKFAI